MGSDNATVQGQTSHNHSMELLEVHEDALATSGAVSLALGLALAANMSWHLRISSEASGRGVLRLVQLQHRLRMLCVPVIVAQLLILTTKVLVFRSNSSWMNLFPHQIPLLYYWNSISSLLVFKEWAHY